VEPAPGAGDKDFVHDLAQACREGPSWRQIFNLPVKVRRLHLSNDRARMFTTRLHPLGLETPRFGQIKKILPPRG